MRPAAGMRTGAGMGPGALAMVFAGGSVGTAVRAAIEATFGAPAGTWPWATFGINLSGAFLLGALLEVLARSGPDTGRRRLLRLGLGTGVLGGYTTYSTFSVETLGLLQSGAWLPGIGYALSSVALGFLAAFAGIRLARALPGASPRRKSGTPGRPGAGS